MEIGILGAGNIGTTLARRLADAGHAVVLGVRDPRSPKAQEAAAQGLTLDSLAAAAQFGAAAVVALPLTAAREVLPGLGLAERIVLDTTNAFGGLPDGFDSAGDAVQAWSGSRRFAKVFNATPWEALADPIYQGMRVETFVCGDDPEAKAVGLGLAQDVGFSAIDLGGLANARLSESFAQLWGVLALQRGYGRAIAFKLLDRAGPAA